METIHQYWYLYELPYLFFSLSITFSFFSTFLLTKKNTKLAVINWISSLFMIVGLFFSTFFYGILLDEFNLQNDLIILGLGVYSVSIFLIHTVKLLVSKLKK